jgi:hypothetical protein
LVIAAFRIRETAKRFKVWNVNIDVAQRRIKSVREDLFFYPQNSQTENDLIELPLIVFSQKGRQLKFECVVRDSQYHSGFAKVALLSFT